MGAVLHTLNPRLHPDELSFIVNDADDRAIVIDASLRLPPLPASGQSQLARGGESHAYPTALTR